MPRRDAFTGQVVAADLKLRKHGGVAVGDFFNQGSYDFYPENIDSEVLSLCCLG